MKTIEGNQMESQSSQTARPFFDEETFLWRMGGDKDDAKALLDAFLKEAKALLALMAADIQRKDAFALRRHAESLHESTSANSSATLQYFARRVACEAELYDFVAAEKLLPKLSDALKALSAQLDAEGWL